MIKANELRIGSLINIGNKTMHVTSISLDIDDEYEESIGYCELGKIINEEIATLCSIEAVPIPLTSEWLERCGFKDGRLKNLRIGYDGDDFIHAQMSVPFDEQLLKVKYLHQLQNLVYALTGEELLIKIP